MNSIYRTNQKCRVSWCVEPAEHDGFHYGEEQRSGLLIKRRTAPPTYTEPSVIEATEFKQVRK